MDCWRWRGSLLLADRQPTLQEASQQPGASGSSVVAALLQDSRTVSQVIDLWSNNGEAEAKSALGAHAYEHAFNAPAFRDISQELRRLDTSTMKVKIEAISLGFDGRCPLVVRVLCDRKLPCKHPTLVQLNDL